MSASRGLTPLEDDLTRLLEANVSSPRDCRLVQRVLGWDGQRGCGQKRAAEEFGITRERARQIYDQSIGQIRSAKTRPAKLGSTLDEALMVVNRMCNRAADDVTVELQRRGLTRHLLPLAALLKTAEVFGRAPDFTLEKTGRKMFVVAGPGLAQSVIKAAVRLSNRQGVQNIAALCSAIPRQHRRRNDALFVRQVLETRKDLRWLDAAHETFWLPSVPRNPMVRCIKKVIAYASPVAVSDLHRAISRLPAKRGTPISRRLLIKFCEQLSFCRVTGGYVERAAPLDPVALI